MSQRASLTTSGQLIPDGKWGRITDINIVFTANAVITLHVGGSTGPTIWAYTSAAAGSISITELTLDFDDSGVYASLTNADPIIVHGEWGGNMPAAVLSGG